jgi:hypothetical protein
MAHTYCSGDGKIILSFMMTVMDHNVIYNMVTASIIIIWLYYLLILEIDLVL